MKGNLWNGSALRKRKAGLTLTTSKRKHVSFVNCQYAGTNQDCAPYIATYMQRS